MGGTLFYRVVPMDRGRGFMLITAWTKPVVQRNCEQLTTLSAITRVSLDKAVASAQALYNATAMVDVTDASVLGQLRKLFGETTAAPVAQKD